jgi:acetyl esterase/lipase
MKTEIGIAFDPATTPMLLDVYRPEAPAKRTAILLLHGGSWRHGSRTNLEPHATALVDRGFVVVVADYRLLPADPWPAQIRDVRAAIRWGRSHASELEVDQDRIVGYGFSAGAHLALIAAGDPGGERYDTLGLQPLDAVIAVEAPVAFQVGQPAPGYTPAEALLGPGASAEAVQSISPITFVTRAFPPTCLFHGMEDKQVPAGASLMMHRALCEAGVISDVHLLAGYAHAIWRMDKLIAPFMDTVSAFLDRTLVNVEPYAAERAAFLEAMRAQAAAAS